MRETTEGMDDRVFFNPRGRVSRPQSPVSTGSAAGYEEQAQETPYVPRAPRLVPRARFFGYLAPRASYLEPAFSGTSRPVPRTPRPFS